jgi:hypothetical protein
MEISGSRWRKMTQILQCTSGSNQWFIEGQAFRGVVWFGSSSPPPPPPSVSLTGDTQEDWETETTCWRERGEGVVHWAESYHGQKAWSSINHSILSDLLVHIFFFHSLPHEPIVPTQFSIFMTLQQLGPQHHRNYRTKNKVSFFHKNRPSFGIRSQSHVTFLSLT